jgi:hypothetical protein
MVKKGGGLSGSQEMPSPAHSRATGLDAATLTAAAHRIARLEVDGRSALDTLSPSLPTRQRSDSAFSSSAAPRQGGERWRCNEAPTRLRVRALEAIDGTPILDLKAVMEESRDE